MFKRVIMETDSGDTEAEVQSCKQTVVTVSNCQSKKFFTHNTDNLDVPSFSNSRGTISIRMICIGLVTVPSWPITHRKC